MKNTDSRVTDTPAFWWAVGLIVVAAASRLIFAPIPNFAPLAGMALFGGAVFRRPLFAFGVPLAALALSDLAVNAVMQGNAFALPNPWVYASFLLIGGMGLLLGRRVSPGTILGGSLAGSVLFFLVTNFGTWAAGYYPMTLSGLMASYSAGLPFFGNTLAGDLFWNGVLFGTFHGLARVRALARA